VTVEVSTKMRFKPFPVPNTVALEMPPGLRQDGFKTGPTFKLDEVDPQVLDALAERWLDNLYASVGKPSPFGRIDQ